MLDPLVIYPPGEKKALEWITTLSAEGLPFQVRQDPHGYILMIPGDSAARAENAIQAYERENLDWPPKPKLKPIRKAPLYDHWTALGMVLLIVIFFIWLGPYNGELALLRIAAADSEGIRAGQWWRAFTAMTLHGDFPHLAGNALFIGWVGSLVCRRLGGGLGAFLILASGACANVWTAWVSSSPHVAVGASTAAFGALGILATLQTVARLREGTNLGSLFSRAWIPIAAAIALLSFMGVSPGSDLAGHFFGFLSGLLLGIPPALWKKGPWPMWGQRLLELATLLLLLGAWKAAANALAIIQ